LASSARHLQQAQVVVAEDDDFNLNVTERLQIVKELAGDAAGEAFRALPTKAVIDFMCLILPATNARRQGCCPLLPAVMPP
jgi:hypothetical protein